MNLYFLFRKFIQSGPLCCMKLHRNKYILFTGFSTTGIILTLNIYEQPRSSRALKYKMKEMKQKRERKKRTNKNTFSLTDKKKRNWFFFCFYSIGEKEIKNRFLNAHSTNIKMCIGIRLSSTQKNKFISFFLNK